MMHSGGVCHTGRSNMAGSKRDRGVDHGSDCQQPPAGRSRPKARISVPMTSMIDVTFLLLTYFLLTTTFRQAEGQLPGTLPKPPIGIELAVVIPVHVRAAGENSQNAVYALDGQDRLIRTPQELIESLRARRDREGGRDLSVEIHAGRAVRWRYVVEAYNQALGAKLPATIRIHSRT
jgi:biopolymer transport protein ExbD